MNEKYKDTLWEVYKCEWGNMKYGGHGFGSTCLKKCCLIEAYLMTDEANAMIVLY